MNPQLKNPDGSWKFTNALVHQTSPYLLQHAHNPVDWRPWAPETFALARQTQKPLFVSIGYSTCYWCHVMERQSFEDPAAAAIVNEHFICVKVDREERPDVDDIYMAAVQIMTGRGGWPMSIFLTPPPPEAPEAPTDPSSLPNPKSQIPNPKSSSSAGLKPFYAGTYFPPQPGHGLPSFTQVIESLGQAWRERREEVLSQADHIADSVREHLSQRDQPAEVNAQLVEAAANQLMRSYDARNGGFGSAPKFPTPSNLLFLLAIQRNNPSRDIAQVIAHTLERMARGGMYDQIGGGFHRYSTDERWLVPHFEKMLYDNGQLLETYARAQGLPLPDAGIDPNEETGLYRRVMRQTCDYVLREMTDPSGASGAFWSAQDAEVDAREGGNYLWQPDEIRQAIRHGSPQAIDDAELAELAIAMYGLDLGTNFQDPHHADAPPANVLYLPLPLPELARKRGVPLDDLLKAKKTVDQRLLAARQQRKQPGTDDKVLVAWNGMMIAGLATAGKSLNEPRYIGAAALAADDILTHLRAPDGGLFRTARQGKAKIPAFLDDYALFTHGLIQLHHATAERRWLDEARHLMDLAIQRFAATPGAVPGAGAGLPGGSARESSGYYDTLADQADLFVRTRSSYDGAVPSGNSQMVHNLLDLFELTAEDSYLDRAGADLRSFAATMQRQGAGMPHMHTALLRYLELTAARQPLVSEVLESRPSPRRQAVRLSVEPRLIELKGGSAEVAVTLHIHPEYHLNTHEAGQEGLIPTELRLENAPGCELEVLYPTGKQRKYPFADQPLTVYEDKVVLHATIRRKAGEGGPAGASGAAPRLVLRYQVCTDQTCLEPREDELPIELTGMA